MSKYQQHHQPSPQPSPGGRGSGYQRRYSCHELGVCQGTPGCEYTCELEHDHAFAPGIIETYTQGVALWKVLAVVAAGTAAAVWAILAIGGLT